MDYNLYGMGHIHLSKMKFRHPVPDAFLPKKSINTEQPKKGMDPFTCAPTDFEVNIITCLYWVVFDKFINILALVRIFGI